MGWDCFKTGKISPRGLPCIWLMKQPQKLLNKTRTIIGMSGPESFDFHPYSEPHRFVLLKGFYSNTHSMLCCLWITLEGPWTQKRTHPFSTSSTLVGSERVLAGHLTKTASVCFLSQRTFCDISPGDNMLIYSAAVEAKCNTPLQSSTHTHTHSFNGLHQSPCYQHISWGPRVYKGGQADRRPVLDRITNAAIYYLTDFCLLSHSPISAFLRQ